MVLLVCVIHLTGESAQCPIGGHSVSVTLRGEPLRRIVYGEKRSFYTITMQAPCEDCVIKKDVIISDYTM